MTKALLDARPERNSHNVLELFTVNQHEIGRFPDVFLHQFEFLDPLFELYEEKTRKLELSVRIFSDISVKGKFIIIE